MSNGLCPNNLCRVYPADKNMRGLFMWKIAILNLLLLACITQAGQQLAIEVKMGTDNIKPSTVVISGRAEQQSWLGISFYPYGTENLLSDGEHQVMELKPGKFEFTFKINSKMVNGSVECASWAKLIKSNDCNGPCDWCITNGHHLEDRQIYLYGSLAAASKGGE
jgi:hypothetical protein